MKLGWVVVSVLLALAAGVVGGAVFGGTAGAAGGGLAGVCYTAQIAVDEGMLTAQQHDSLLDAVVAKHAARAQRIDVGGDLRSACKDLLARDR